MFGERMCSKRGTERVAQHDRLPAQMRHGGVKRLREVQAFEIRRKQDVWADRGVQIRLRHVTRSARHPVVDEISGQGLARTPEWTSRALLSPGVHSGGGCLNVRASELTNIAASAPGTNPN